MNYYYDTEFLEGTQDKRFLGIKYGVTKPTIDLISIGIVAEDSREYYAISKDFNLREAWNRFDIKETSPAKKYMGFYTKKVYWIRENVLKPIFKDKNKSYNVLKGLPYSMELPFNYKSFKMILKLFGKSNEQIAQEVKEFVYNAEYYWSDPAVYDYKIKETIDKGIKFYGYYSAYDHTALCCLFGKMLNLPKGFPMYTIDLRQMKDVIKDRYKKDNIDYGLSEDHNYPQQENEHSAIDDARWNRALHKFLERL